MIYLLYGSSIDVALIGNKRYTYNERSGGGHLRMISYGQQI